MNRIVGFASLGAVLLIATSVARADTGDIERGKALFGVCAGCHGVDAMGSEGLKAPRLAGQFDWYIATQLRNFRSGLRGTAEGDTAGAMMRPMASTLADEQAILDVSAYLASL